jgi:hypothetical protein
MSSLGTDLLLYMGMVRGMDRSRSVHKLSSFVHKVGCKVRKHLRIARVCDKVSGRNGFRISVSCRKEGRKKLRCANRVGS